MAIFLSLLLRISHTYLLRRRFWKRLCVSVCFVDGSMRFAVAFFPPFRVNISGSTTWHKWWAGPRFRPNGVWAREKLSDGRNLPFRSSHLSRHVLAGTCKRIRATALTNDTPKSGVVSDLSWWPSSAWTNQNSRVSERCPLGSSICQQFGSRASRLEWVEAGWGFLC